MVHSFIDVERFFPCVWKFNCLTEITQMAVCFLQIGAPGRSFLRTASALQIHTLLPVDLLTERTSLKRRVKIEKRKYDLEACIELIAV